MTYIPSHLTQERDTASKAWTRLEAEKEALTGLLREYRGIFVSDCIESNFAGRDTRCDLCKRTDVLLNPKEDDRG